MSGTLRIIWDYDGPIGQVNSSFPYNFDERKLLREIENVDTILDLAKKFSIPMTFACTGFSAEPGDYPYHIGDQLKKINSQGHEIASHSWRHEWFPFLTNEQIRLSLSRSKFALETCVGVQGAVKGFVIPFSRPMSWYARGALSLGDRAFGPWRKGASLGSLIKLIGEAGYKWTRVFYRPIWQELLSDRTQNRNYSKSWENYHVVTLIPSHYFGFDQIAKDYLLSAINHGGDLVISGHPAALSFGREESLENLVTFLELTASERDQGKLLVKTVSEGLFNLNE
ncbi:MAG: polysaccharide deacetylase family protein [Anaerolineaceae bacterium]|jgi:peptidoglycan/xylan/chitin deacetylase (PgdA/CDA1 family)